MRRLLINCTLAGVLAYTIVACGGPDPEALPDVGHVLGKVELTWGDRAFLIDFPTEHRRCVISSDDGVDCWSTLVTQPASP